MSGKFNIRPAKEDELDILMEWSTKENWSVCIHETRAIHMYDPQGLLVAVNDDDEPLGFIAVINHSDNMSFIGFFIVRKDLRGKGIGKRLFEAGERHIGGRNVALCAVLDKIQLYERWGFPNKAFEIDTFIGKPNLPGLNMENDKILLSVLRDDLFSSVVQYDLGIHTTKREHFLSKWLTADVTCTLVATSDGQVAGYGCLYKKGHKSFAIAPLFADSFEIANVLLNNLLLKLEPGSEIKFYVPSTHRRLAELLQCYGFQRYSGYLRMSRREHPNIPLDKVFFLTDVDVSLI